MVYEDGFSGRSVLVNYRVHNMRDDANFTGNCRGEDGYFQVAIAAAISYI